MERTAVQGGPGDSHTYTLATRPASEKTALWSRREGPGAERVSQVSICGRVEREGGLGPSPPHKPVAEEGEDPRNAGLAALSMPTFGTCSPSSASVLYTW